MPRPGPAAGSACARRGPYSIRLNPRVAGRAAGVCGVRHGKRGSGKDCPVRGGLGAGWAKMWTQDEREVNLCMEATVRGVRLAYEDVGQGAPVVFVHAFPLHKAMWRRQVEAVAAAGWRAIAVDLRGFGQSELGREPFTIDGSADDVTALLDQLGIREPVVLVGLSMGGYVAFGCVRRHSQRLRALVLADTRAEPDTDEARAGRLETARRVEAEGVGPVVESMLPRLVGATTHRERPAVVAEVRAMMEAARPEGVAAALRGLAARPDSRPDLSRIAVPALVVVGQEDAITPPADAEALHGAIKDSRLAVIPGAGHLPNMETPEAFNAALLDFLGGLRG